MNSRKAIVSLSGGMDSTTVLAWLLDSKYDVECLSFFYNSKHNSYELHAAGKIANYYDVPWKLIDVSESFKLFNSNLLKEGGDIPEGHYTDKNMSQTVVPGRNMIFLTILAGYAWSVGAENIAIGIHQGDHAIYADCRREFFMAMNSAIYLGTDRNVEVIAPFQNTDKYGILKWGFDHNVPYYLTRTCYKDQQEACGKCGSCVERLEAFSHTGIQDPIKYQKDLNYRKKTNEH